MKYALFSTAENSEDAIDAIDYLLEDLVLNGLHAFTLNGDTKFTSVGAAIERIAEVVNAMLPETGVTDTASREAIYDEYERLAETADATKVDARKAHLAQSIRDLEAKARENVIKTRGELVTALTGYTDGELPQSGEAFAWKARPVAEADGFLSVVNGLSRAKDDSTVIEAARNIVHRELNDLERLVDNFLNTSSSEWRNVSKRAFDGGRVLAIQRLRMRLDTYDN